MSDQPLISVAVCTYNRPRWLRHVLADLAAQNLERHRYEVLVVDNNSRDETARVAGEFARANANFRYVCEPEQGLSRARNRGWREARGEYVGYTDDDCRVPADWLAVAAGIIGTRRPAVFGGPYYPFYDRPKPAWFKDEYQAHVQGASPRPLTGADEFLDGGNLFVRRDVLAALGGFDPHLGMAGARLASGEETALMRRVRQEMPGEEIYYHPELKVSHLVPAHKFGLRWNVWRAFADGRCSWRAAGAAAPGTPRAMRGWLWATLRALGMGVVRMRRRDYRRYPYYQNYVWECLLPHVRTLGSLYEYYCAQRAFGSGGQQSRR